MDLPAAPAQRPTVLFIGGFGRSGSTLLERVLGQVPGVQPLGEVVHLWERGLLEDDLCGCGRPFSRCTFWTRVGAEAYGGWDRIDAAEAVADKYAVVRNHNLVRLVFGWSRGGWGEKYNRMLHRADRLYAAAAATAGARVLVDSSKHPAYAFLLRRSQVRLVSVLMVRDPRGVAYSWTKEVRPQVAGEKTVMPQYGPSSSAWYWSLYIWLFRALQLLGVPLQIVRYEDFVVDPQGTVRRLLSDASVDVDMDVDEWGIQGSGVVLDTHHTVAGNPMRFKTGFVPLRLDEQWREAMPRRQRHLVSALTAVSRSRLGYR